MKIASCIAIALAGSATAQDMIVDVICLPNNEFALTAQFFGTIPGNATAIGAVWADTSFSLTALPGETINITSVNPGYTSAIFGGPVITGDGTDEVTFVGLQPGGGLGSPDPSNPLEVLRFTRSGSGMLPNVDFEMIGQNSALFTGNPAEPFGTIALYQDVNGNAGSLSWGTGLFCFPTPGATGAFALAGFVAARRTRTV